MAYVPGFEWDVFVSYAHVSDKRGWVSRFKKDLEDSLATCMSPSPKVWIDQSKLRIEEAYPGQIATELSTSAVLLTVNCEPYMNSPFCAWEWTQFRKELGNNPKPENDNRIVEVYMSLLSDNSCPKRRPDYNGFWFCDDPEKEEDPDTTFEIGSDKYKLAMRRLSKEVRNLLFSMRKERECVFLSPPVDASNPNSPLADQYKKLRKELERTYQVVPFQGNNQPDSESLAMARLSIHFLSTKFDDLTVKRIRAARQANQRTLVIFAPELLNEPNNPMSKFRLRLESAMRPQNDSGDAPPATLRLFDWVPPKHTTDDLLNLVKAMMARPERNGPIESFVYVICDGRDSREESFKELKGILNDSLKKVELFLPQESDEAYLTHMTKLNECDGVLLVWGMAEVDWFSGFLAELEVAAGFRSGRPLRSKAVCLLKPIIDSKRSATEDLDPREVINFWEGIDRHKLERFLTALRTA